MKFLRNLVRPILPDWIRQKVRDARTQHEIKAWRALNIRHNTAGLEIEISNQSDWEVFKEIFVQGIYDSAISRVLSNAQSNQTINIFDLGANVGLFTMRFAQKVFESSSPDRPFTIRCVEGSPSVYSSLSARLAANPRLQQHVSCYNGLVGRKNGATDIYQSIFGAGNTTNPQHWSKPVTVNYIDLETLTLPDERFALIKCDIEGSEQQFQDNYHSLLRRTDLVAIELHHAHIDSERFLEGMTSLGFTQSEILWKDVNARASVVLFSQRMN